MGLGGKTDVCCMKFVSRAKIIIGWESRRIGGDEESSRKWPLFFQMLLVYPLQWQVGSCLTFVKTISNEPCK